MTNIAFIDVETTGLDPTMHELIEVGAIVVTPDLSRILAEYSVLIVPQHPETARLGEQGARPAFEVNGYDPDLWDTFGTDLDTALTGLASVIDGCVLAGQNVRFDEGFLRAGYASCGRPWPAHGYRTFDLVGLCWPLQASGVVRSMSLDSLCRYFGLERPPVHRALADARAALEVARRMMALVQLPAEAA